MAGHALLLTGLAVYGSSAVAAMLPAALTLAAALGGPSCGSLLDRAAHPGRLLAFLLTSCAAALALTVLCLGRFPLPCALAAALLCGLCGPALSGGWSAQLPRLYEGEALRRASALDALSFPVGALPAPAAAGALAVTAGPSAGAVVAVTLICASLPAALRLPGGGPEGRGRRVQGARAPTSGGGHGDSAPPGRRARGAKAAGFVRLRAAARSAKGALRAPFATPRLARATSASVASAAGEGAFVVSLPLLGAREFGESGHGTALLALSAAGAVTAAAVWVRVTRPGPDAVLAAAPAALAVACGLAATTAHPWMLVAAVLLAGCAEGPQLAALFAVRHQEAPAGARGRVFTTGASVKLSGYSVGVVVGGFLASYWVPGAPAAAGVLHLVGLGILLARKAR